MLPAMNKTYVIGVGMTKFEKPQTRDWDYPDMAREAGSKALEDAGIAYDAVEQACVGYCYGESTSGQRAVYELGLTGIPVTNVNNNCSTGSTALYMARQLVKGGLADCTLALGFEKMQKGSLGANFMDREQPTMRHFTALAEVREMVNAPPAPQMFGMAGCQHMVTDTPESFEDKSAISVVGGKMTKKAAEQVYEEAEMGPDEVDVIELHDCFSANEMITYEALGIAEEGEAHKLVEAEATTYGGDGPVVNPSGGLISKGHPLGATGLAQCSELTWQLRGQSDKRQVEGAKTALQHNIGIGGAVVVTLYRPAANG